MFVYRMPIGLTVSAAALGAANGLLPIGWVVFTAILLYRLTVETGKFEIIKNSLGSLTSDQRLQALLIAAANPSGGVMGKMIGLQNIAMAAAASGMVHTEEGRLFRFTLRHSIFMAAVVGVIVMFYAYGMPGWVL